MNSDERQWMRDNMYVTQMPDALWYVQRKTELLHAKAFRTADEAATYALSLRHGG